MISRHIGWMIGCVAWLAASPAAAMVYVGMADEDLADQAPVIAVARLRAIEPGPGAGGPTGFLFE